ncbi:MAG: DUF4352 domain-containing protein [Actinobacteria bacterium]|nr:DUF4352 domain-containing protein [Actinomycetota bacterium]MBU1944168.1 DUF4352 domain-containing protein [Actinomycetota bacterium]MBU2687487.1 DUF4352 domain-containing protein [Actinomycetota bacterium]
MRLKAFIPVLASILLFAGLGGCAERQAAGPGSSTISMPDLPATRIYEARFDDAIVTLTIPSASERAEQMRMVMSQSPPYLIADMRIENTGGEIIRYYDFKPVLLYEGGKRYEGSSRTEFETDRIAPGETLTGLFQFAVSDLYGLDEVLIERAGSEPREAR